MDRISTANSYSAILANLQTAQGRASTAAQQVSSGNIASDLKGYAAQADALTATQTVASRLGAYTDANAALNDRLEAQASALDTVQTSAAGASKAILTAIGNGDAATLTDQLQGFYEQASDALNANYQGQYLFAGGVADTAPMAKGTLATLDPDTVFRNGDQKTVSRIDDNITIQTGMTASDVGKPLMNALAGVNKYLAGPPVKTFSTPLSPDDVTALQDVLVDFNGGTKSDGTTVAKGVNAQLIAVGAQNGAVQARVTSETSAISDRKDAATKVVSTLSDADAAQAVSDLQLAQVALQASAQVFSSLQSSSLLSVLPAS